jgi:hypothetical protein
MLGERSGQVHKIRFLIRIIQALFPRFRQHAPKNTSPKPNPHPSLFLYLLPFFKTGRLPRKINPAPISKT